MKLARPLALVVVLSSPLGCYNARVRAPVSPHGEKIVDTGVSFLWGMTNTNTQALECPQGLAYVETYHPWWSAFIVGPLTLGIITPIRKVYQCAAPQQAAPQQIIVLPGGVAPVQVAPAPAPRATPDAKK